MAKRNFRIEAGLTNPADKADFDQLLAQFSPYQDELIGAIEANNSGDPGKFKALFAKMKGKLGDNEQGVIDKVNALNAKLPGEANAFRSYLTQTKDEANATDEELQNRLQAYQGLGRTGEELDTASVQRWLKQALDTQDVQGRLKVKEGDKYPEGSWVDYTGPGSVVKGYQSLGQSIFGGGGIFGGEGGDTVDRVMPGFRNAIESEITDYVVKNRRLPDLGTLRDLINSHGGPGQQVIGDAKLQNFLNNQENSNYVALTLGGQPKDYKDDLSRVQGLIDTRATEGRKTEAVNNFLKTTPDELAAARQGFYQQQQASGAQYLRTRLTPKIITDLNERGLAEGPDVGSMIAAQGSTLQASLEDKIRSLEAQDNQFFADSAFRLTQAKLSASEDALNQQIAYERAGAKQRQEQNFQARESDIQNEFDAALLKKEQDRELALSQEGIDTAASRDQTNTINDLTQDLSKTAGSAVATKIAKPSGAPSTQAAAAPSVTTFDKIG